MIFKTWSQPLKASILFLFISSVAHGQGSCGPRIGDTAPSFTAETTEGRLRFPEDFEGSWTVLFSHPADFTPVCATEFKKFASMIPQFEEMNAKILGLSTDDRYMHADWKKHLEEAGPNISFPIIADKDKRIAHAYGMIHPAASDTKTVRAVYIIDPQAKVRAIMYYPLTNGRSFREIKRLVSALQTSDEEKVLTPAEWEPGDKTITPPKETSRRQSA